MSTAPVPAPSFRTSIGLETYYKRFVPTRFDPPNVPWFKDNQCPFYRMAPALPFFPPGQQGGTPLNGVSQDPDCPYGMAPSQNQTCCDVFGTCLNQSTK